MNGKNLYQNVSQLYYSLETQKRNLIKTRDKAEAQLNIIENMLIDINDILCKHGRHFYEHFEEECTEKEDMGKVESEE